MGLVYWSVDPTTTAGPPYAGFSAADIFVGPAAPGYSGAPTVYATAAALGLQSGDDINALVVGEDGTAGFNPVSDCILFSLATGSPSLPIVGATPADVLSVGCGIGGVAMFVPFPAIGLAFGDDLNALAIPFTPTAVTVESVATRAGQAGMPRQWLVTLPVAVLAISTVALLRRRRHG